MCGVDKSTTVTCHDKQRRPRGTDSNLGIDGQPKIDLSLYNGCLLELAAENDLEGFRRHVEEINCKVDVVGPWYVRRNGPRQMVVEQRTPAMVAALYGSLDVLNFILKCYGLYGGDINQQCGHDCSTALHSAASGGSKLALEVARVLLEWGADPTLCDALGKRPCDLIYVPCWLDHTRKSLMEILKVTKWGNVDGNTVLEFSSDNPDKYSSLSSSDGRSLPSEDGNSAEVLLLSAGCSSSLGTGLVSSSSITPSSPPAALRAMGSKFSSDKAEKAWEYPIDPSLPDIKDGIFTTDEFRMYSFKIRPCSRAYSHDWTECPFVHPGENARRRDPRRYHYSCVPCLEFRKGSCRRGDMCEYAHGVFECWLHPAQYRTRFCKDGTSCDRRVCFFAHTAEELRPLLVATGSAILSPRSNAFGDMAQMSPPLAPDSPFILSPYSQAQSSYNKIHGTPPMSPSSSPSLFIGSPAYQPIPSLHLPGASLQSSRLKSSLAACSTSMTESLALIDFERQNLNDFQVISSQPLSTQGHLRAAVVASGGISNASVHAGKYSSLGLNMVPNNVAELFAPKIFPASKSLEPDTSAFSQLDAQLLAQSESPLSPVSTQMQQLQAQNADSEIHFNHPMTSLAFTRNSLSVSSLLGGLNAERQVTKDAPPFPSLLAARAALAQRDRRSHSSRDLGANCMSSNWCSPTGKLEWSVHSEELSKLRKSTSFGFRSTEAPDQSCVHKLKKEMPSGMVSQSSFSANGVNDQRESTDSSLLGSWTDKLNLDQIDS